MSALYMQLLYSLMAILGVIVGFILFHCDFPRIRFPSINFPKSFIKRRRSGLFSCSKCKFYKSISRCITEYSSKRGSIGGLKHIFGPVFGFTFYLRDERKKNFHWEFPRNEYPRFLRLFTDNVGSMAKGGIWDR